MCFGDNFEAASSLSLLFAASGFAQRDMASIVGTVKDASGAIVPNAKVTATEVQKQISYHTITNGAGQYGLPWMTCRNSKFRQTTTVPSSAAATARSSMPSRSPEQTSWMGTFGIFCGTTGWTRATASVPSRFSPVPRPGLWKRRLRHVSAIGDQLYLPTSVGPWNSMGAAPFRVRWPIVGRLEYFGYPHAADGQLVYSRGWQCQFRV